MPDKCLYSPSQLEWSLLQAPKSPGERRGYGGLVEILPSWKGQERPGAGKWTCVNPPLISVSLCAGALMRFLGFVVHVGAVVTSSSPPRSRPHVSRPQHPILVRGTSDWPSAGQLHVQRPPGRGRGRGHTVHTPLPGPRPSGALGKGNSLGAVQRFPRIYRSQESVYGGSEGGHSDLFGGSTPREPVSVQGWRWL